jgi:hypothetical protein
MHLLYLVGEVEKEDLLMVSLEWNTLLMGGIECCSWATFPHPGRNLNSDHGQGPARAGPPGHLVEML